MAVSLLSAPLAAQAQATSPQVRVAVGYKAGTGALVRAAIARAGGSIDADMSEADALVVQLPRAKIGRAHV
jgi:hypothetical protein